ncbi:hypothetical protein JKP88DRAFT_244831 [Tribonema minus]|uniref:J domain-containing protein n=1 Tax=Tribonema minus TaxID=303371 RepID=A0A835Z073_9STRA|nr:hypothetical protein JKP88DRAFT_244831 [Tribonema minus]
MQGPQHHDRDALLLRKLKSGSKISRIILYMVSINMCSAPWQDYRELFNTHTTVLPPRPPYNTSMVCSGLQHPGRQQMAASKWTRSGAVPHLNPYRWQHPLMWVDNEGVYHLMSDIVRIARGLLLKYTLNAVDAFNAASKTPPRKRKALRQNETEGGGTDDRMEQDTESTQPDNLDDANDASTGEEAPSSDPPIEIASDGGAEIASDGDADSDDDADGNGTYDVEMLQRVSTAAQTALHAAYASAARANTTSDKQRAQQAVVQAEKEFSRAYRRHFKAQQHIEREQARQRFAAVLQSESSDEEVDDVICTFCPRVDGFVCPLSTLGLVCAGVYDTRTITHAYRRAALRTHPDKPGGVKDDFQKVSDAYKEILRLSGVTV